MIRIIMKRKKLIRKERMWNYGSNKIEDVRIDGT